MRRLARAASAALVCAAMAAACVRPVGPAGGRRLRASELDPARLHAVLVNGGGEPETNYRSHLGHLRAALRVLRAARVPRANVAVFASDGSDPEPDLAARAEPSARAAELLDGTWLEGLGDPPLELVDTRLDGWPVRPATRAALGAWFADEGAALGPGDTLLLFVTDHGRLGAASDPLSSEIVLWGADEAVSARELGRWLAGLRPGVRVVALMSQCYSGGFAEMEIAGEGEFPGPASFCGFFSTTWDRTAYGCYPEDRGVAGIGHSLRFLEALAALGRFDAAHRRTLWTDGTPDVPLRTSDVFLRAFLEREAAARGEELGALVDEELARPAPAPDEPAEWAALESVAASFGISTPRSLAELRRWEEHELEPVRERLRRWTEAWDEAAADLASANVERFLDCEPRWRERLVGDDSVELEPQDTAIFLDALAAYTRARPRVARRLRRLRRRFERAESLAERMDVREAVARRLETLLVAIAGRRRIAGGADAVAKARYEELRRCEEVALPVHAPPPPPRPFPSFERDLARLARVRPAWLGIRFRSAVAGERERLGLPPGAVRVQAVYPGSPADRAGIEPGDILLGPPGRPFSEPHQIREWTMVSPTGEPRSLELVRDGAPRVVELLLAPHPGALPELLAALEPGARAPALTLEPYRGTVPIQLADGRRRLLFFWATWCAACKAALPDVRAFEAEEGAEVIAITDEAADDVDAFLARTATELPAHVALDVDRDVFSSYGVKAVPTFVLIGSDGRVEAVREGYRPSVGLELPGWRPRPATGE